MTADEGRPGAGDRPHRRLRRLAAYDPVAVDTRQRLRANPDLRQPAAERTQASKERAVSFAAYAALVDQFPAPRRSMPSG